MFGFPIGNGNAGFNDFVEKFTNNADSGFPNIQQREVFYSIKSGDWNDPTIWQNASGRIGLIPSTLDDVYIRHTVRIVEYGRSCNNLNITGTLTTDNQGRNFFVNGEIQCHGTVDLSVGTGTSLNLRGVCDKSFITNLIQSTSSLIAYSRFGGIQYVLNLPYVDLTIGGTGIKYLTSDIVVGRNFALTTSATSGGSIFDLLNYSFTVTGTTTLGSQNLIGTNFSINVAILTKTGGGGNVTFIGAITHNGDCYWNFSMSNVDVEFRGGYSRPNAGNGVSARYPNDLPQLGLCRLVLSTNNQTIENGSNANLAISRWDFVGDVLIKGAITATFTSTSGYGYSFSSLINGDNASSTVVNRTNFYFINQYAAENAMSTGVFDITSFGNTVHYAGNYSATIPSRFTTFHNLTISGTGTKTLGVNTTLNGNLTASNGTFELSSYNLSVTGTSTINGGYLKKSGAGSVLFTGLLSVSSAFANALDFTTGNPSVEVRGGITYGLNIASTYQINGGLGTWTFSTNNQSITGNQGVSWMQLYDVLIGSGITLTIATSNAVMVQINNSINGNSATSKLLGGTNGRIALNTNIQPMTTGIWDFTTNICYVKYMSTSNQTIWHSTYSHLELENNSTKTLSANTTINNTLTCLTDNINSIFELSTYNLTINGTTTLRGKISKSGAGNILFVGLVTWYDLISGIDFSGGNPTIETRNGFRYINGSTSVTMTLGSSVWNFTTNNQSLYGTAVGTYGNFSGGTFNIANDITLTIGSTLQINGTINGGNANSKLLMAASTSMNYQSATQPMATGVLDTSTNLNTWIYGLSNQDIKGSPTTSPKQVYRNLTLNGGGVKTLQGYVSVQNTYTLTAPATLALNGYTLTNP